VNSSLGGPEIRSFKCSARSPEGPHAEFLGKEDMTVFNVRQSTVKDGNEGPEVGGVPSGCFSNND
jgi:hypothetical protein